MVNKLRSLCEKRSSTCKKNKSDTLLNSNSYVDLDTGMFPQNPESCFHYNDKCMHAGVLFNTVSLPIIQNSTVHVFFIPFS